MSGKCKYPDSACGNMTLFHGVAYCDSTPCILQGDAPPKTNADRIRAMSDDELAEFLAYTWATSARAWEPEYGETLYWLQQPAKED